MYRLVESKLDKTFESKAKYLTLNLDSVLSRVFEKSEGATRISPGSLSIEFTENHRIFNFHLYSRNRNFEENPLTDIQMRAAQRWSKILSFTHSDDASILIIDETIDQSLLEIGRHGQRLPQTLLDKLLKLLLERYAAFQGRPGSGMLILSTGSLTGYAYRLEAHILELAHVNRIAPEFLDWIEHANYFCDPWMD